MSFYDKLDDVREGNISQIEVINEILNQTQKEPERIQMYIDEIDFYLFVEKENLQYKTVSFLDKLFENKFNIELDAPLFSGREKYIFNVCQKENYKSHFDLPHKKKTSLFSESENKEYVVIEYEKTFYPHEFILIYSLKHKLKKYLTPQQIIPKEKTPFSDPKSYELFNYIVDNWNYNRDLRYAYIYNYLVDILGYQIDRTEYEKYIRSRFNINRVYFDNANREKNIQQLEVVVTNYERV